jgi:predicted PurR-regulated permease PerM
MASEPGPRETTSPPVAPLADTPSARTPITGEGGILPRFAPSQVTPRTVVVVFFTLLALAGGCYLFWQLRQIVRWTFIALFLAVALNPAVAWLERRRMQRGLAIGIVYLLLLLFFAALAALIAPPLVDQTQALVGYIRASFQRPEGAGSILRDLANRVGLGAYVDTLVQQIQSLPLSLSNISGPLLSVTRGVVSSVSAFLSILLLTFFFLLDGERFVSAGLLLFAEAQRPRMRRVLEQSAQSVYGYVSGNLFISLICGVGVFLVLTILGLPYAVPLALLVAILDLLPLVGATLGAIVVVLVGVFFSPVKGAIALTYFIVYQQIENNVLQPLVYGRSVRLHPLVVFLAVLAGSQLLGILGALLAIPVADVIRIIGAEWFASRAQAKGGVVHGTQEETPIDVVAADAIDNARDGGPQTAIGNGEESG